MGIQRCIINKNIPVPLYYQLKQIILEEIKSGNLKPGDALPIEVELEKIFSISRTTIRQAIKELVFEGYVYRVKSKGTFVAKPKIPQLILAKLGSFREEMAEQGFIASMKILEQSIIFPPVDVAQALNISTNQKVFKSYNVRYADDEPILISLQYVTPALSYFETVDLNKIGFYEMLAKDERTRVVCSKRIVESKIATDIEHKLLKVPKGFPIQSISSVDYNSQGVPCVYYILNYRGDRNKFEVELCLDMDK